MQGKYIPLPIYLNRKWNPQHDIKVGCLHQDSPGTAFEIYCLNRCIMKHSKQEETSKHQGAATDQGKKTGKTQQSGRDDAMESGSQSSKGNREHSSGQEDNSNWQKEKQGNRK